MYSAVIAASNEAARGRRRKINNERFLFKNVLLVHRKITRFSQEIYCEPIILFEPLNGVSLDWSN